MSKSLLSGLAVLAALSGPAALGTDRVVAQPPSVQQRARSPDLLKTGDGTVAHIFGCGVGIYRARQHVRKHGVDRAMELFPRLRGAKLVKVPFSVCREISRSKWDGADLREIRARNGVGRPPHG